MQHKWNVIVYGDVIVPCHVTDYILANAFSVRNKIILLWLWPLQVFWTAAKWQSWNAFHAIFHLRVVVASFTQFSGFSNCLMNRLNDPMGTRLTLWSTDQWNNRSDPMGWKIFLLHDLITGWASSCPLLSLKCSWALMSHLIHILLGPFAFSSLWLKY